MVPQIQRVSRNTAPAAKTGIFWVLKGGCFCRTFSQCAIGWFSWISLINRWHTVGQQCFKPRPQTAPVKVNGGRRDYHDFEASLLTMLLVLASQALTDCATKTILLHYSKYTYSGGQCGRCGIRDTADWEVQRQFVASWIRFRWSRWVSMQTLWHT